MNEQDLSDRKWKVAVVLAMAVLGLLCFNNATFGHAQGRPANLAPGIQEVVKLSQANASQATISSYIKDSNIFYSPEEDQTSEADAENAALDAITPIIPPQAY